MADRLEQVAIRMVEQPPLYSEEPMDSPRAAVRVMKEFLAQMDRELFCIVNLQADLRPINMNIVSVGALDHTLTHPREVFKSAILSNASGMILIHNHPSGNLTPSKADIAVTDRLQKGAALLGIQIYDHIIVSKEKAYYSFREKDMVPEESLTYIGNLNELQLDGQMAAEETPGFRLPGKDIDSIMKSLENGVADLFSSERYTEYLRTMAKFHNYSFNNTLLIALQRPDATMVTGYRNWQSMGRQVKKGEKGITIIAPTPIKKKQMREVLDENRRPVLDEKGEPVFKEVEVKLPRFKAITVFDIAQTVGEPIELLEPEELREAVKDYDLFMKAITEISSVPIRFDEISGNAKGYYHTEKKEIVIKKEMSESRTIKTAIHESAHARLHDKALTGQSEVKKDRLTKEVEAESVAYCVCSSLGLDTSDYSFPYIAGWSSDKNIKELKMSMDTIRHTAGDMIDALSEKIQELTSERKTELEKEQKKLLIPAMEAAGYRYKEQDSLDGILRFMPDGIHEVSGPLYAESWDDVREWLDQRILTEPLDKERIGRVLHPEQFDKTSEQMMFEMTGTRFSLYQIPADSPGWAYKFTGIEALQKQGLEVKASDYECVYSGQMLPSDNLDTLYSMFNDNYPADFKSHSLSVSDVIVTNQGAELHSYYIDSFGFTELPDFAAQRQEILGITKENLRFDILNDSDCISFYTAECSEFPVMGECHTGLSLEDAFEKYDQIPGERMNGVKCIGFDLQDGSEWSGMFPLVTGNSIDKKLINSIPGFRDNRLVQIAVERAEKLLEKRSHEKSAPEKREEKQRGNEAPKRKRREDVSL